MELKKITEKVIVSPQITAADMDDIKAAGIRAIICNRPDGEGADQPTFEELTQTAAKLGLDMRHIPVSGGMVHDADVGKFSAQFAALPKPMLAFCRTGTRSATLWSLA